MKRLRIAALAVGGLAVAGLASPALADPVHGLWRTPPDAQGLVALVQLVECDDRVCGRLVTYYDAGGRPIASADAGRHLVRDMEPRGSGRYREGRRWLPGREGEHRARMDLAGDRLTVRHCRLPWICHEEIWERAN